ncbi:hypothetical protein N7486_009312 [Penicillium sp. IBT 16267x]|nr:hypothetical protein N7486_009312 [Penicillium sp. IBT 16267x]
MFFSRIAVPRSPSMNPNSTPTAPDVQIDYGVEDFSDEEYSEAESNGGGGMYLDAPDRATSLEYSHPRRIPQALRDENDFSTQAPGPNSYVQQPGSAGSRNAATYETGDSKPKPIPRSRLSGEEHAALTVLNDEELLTMYALKSGRTLPQTRRRFQAKLIANGDRDLEEELFAARFAVPASKAHLVPALNPIALGPGAPEQALGLNNTTAYLVPATWKELVDHDESGWWAPGQRPKADGGGRRARKSGGIGSRGGSGEVSRSASASREDLAFNTF